MIRQLSGVLSFTDEEIAFVRSLGALKGKMWEQRDDGIKNLKARIREQLSVLQDHECAYCGFKMGITSNDEIEHIAPKGKVGNRVLYPQFMFTEKNLVLACHYCNCIMKKGTFDTIEVYNDDYERCTFKIVHPYFDDPEQHYEWIGGRESSLIQIKNNSVKAQTSISLFGLDSIHHSMERAEKNIIRLLKATLPADEYEDLINRANNFK